MTTTKRPARNVEAGDLGLTAKEMVQHTPGPCSRAAIVDRGVLVPTSGIVQSTSILPLVAAAPELLEACKRWEIILSADCTDGATLTALRKLIAKAEGRTP